MNETFKAEKRAGRDPEAEDAAPLPVNHIVGFYLVNRRGGLMDFTGAFDAFDAFDAFEAFEDDKEDAREKTVGRNAKRRRSRIPPKR